MQNKTVGDALHVILPHFLLEFEKYENLYKNLKNKVKNFRKKLFDLFFLLKRFDSRIDSTLICPINSPRTHIKIVDPWKTFKYKRAKMPNAVIFSLFLSFFKEYSK